MGTPVFYIKDMFLTYLEEHQNMVFGDMFFRLYNPQKDSIVGNYDEEDWKKIFIDITEEDLKELSDCLNVVILLWCDTKTESPHGMLYLEESHLCAKEVCFHGGTWDHNPKLFIKIYRSIISIFRFLLGAGATITTTCKLDNTRSNRFLHSLCLDETRRDETISYKTLNREKFEKSILTSRIAPWKMSSHIVNRFQKEGNIGL